MPKRRRTAPSRGLSRASVGRLEPLPAAAGRSAARRRGEGVERRAGRGAGRDRRPGAEGSGLPRPSRPSGRRLRGAGTDGGHPAGAGHRPGMVAWPWRAWATWAGRCCGIAASRIGAFASWPCSTRTRRRSASGWTAWKCILPERWRKCCPRWGWNWACLTVPAESAQAVADAMVSAGVRGLLTFAPGVLRLPAGVSVVSVDLTVQLEQLAFLVQAQRRRLAATRRGRARASPSGRG